MTYVVYVVTAGGILSKHTETDSSTVLVAAKTEALRDHRCEVLIVTTKGIVTHVEFSARKDVVSK